MLAPTHSAFSILCTAAILQTVNPVILGIAGATSLLPDIDHSKSISGRLFYPISKFISSRFAHRTITHSWIAVSIFLCLSFIVWVFAPLCAGAIFIGYLSGILGDMLTKNGVNFVYPAKVSVIIFRNPALRFKTGSISEFVLLIFIFLGTIGVFNLYSQGGLIKIYESFVGNPTTAIDYYNNHFNQYIINAKVEGFRGSDRLPINQQYRIIKVDGNVFTLQDSKGYIYRAGSSGNVEIIIERIRVSKSYNATVRSNIVVFADEQILSKINSLQLGDENYLFGELNVEDADTLKFPVSNNYLWPVDVEGDKLIIHGARIKQLQSIGNRYGSGELSIIKVNY